MCALRQSLKWNVIFVTEKVSIVRSEALMTVLSGITKTSPEHSVPSNREQIKDKFIALGKFNHWWSYKMLHNEKKVMHLLIM